MKPPAAITHSNMFKIGTGFNVGFVNNKACKAHLSFPKEASLLELGPEELIAFKDSILQIKQMQDLLISLHIARSPITESKNTQKEYIHKILSLSKENKFDNIGFHLTGPRASNIGKYGFSAYYDPNNALLELNAIKFILRAQDKLGCEVWLENTNFYSTTVDGPLALWDSIRRICEKTNVKLILDLAHHLIDCQNVGLSPELLFGAISWKNIGEIHLSGITQSKDGAYHDGHSQPISEALWSYLEKIIAYFVKDLKSLYVTLEHTDFSWTKEPECFYKDFQKLANIQRSLNLHPSSTSRTFSANAEYYAKSRLKKFLILHFPKTKLNCQSQGIDFDLLCDQWFSFVNLNDGTRLVFSSYEEEPNTQNSKKLFTQFLMENYSNVYRD